MSNCENLQHAVWNYGRVEHDRCYLHSSELQEKYLAKKKYLWMVLVDLEKVFDKVPQDVIWWALRYLGVNEWIVPVIKAMHGDK